MDIEKKWRKVCSYISIILLVLILPRVIVYCFDVFCIKFFDLSLNVNHIYDESFFRGMWDSIWYSFFSDDVVYKIVVNSTTIGVIVAILISLKLNKK